MSAKRKYLNKLDFASIFYSDLENEADLYAVIVRSPISSGTIRSISTGILPEGYTLITAADIPGVNQLETVDTLFPILAYERISYQGEPIGILVGPDILELHKIMHKLDIRFTRSTQIEPSQHVLPDNVIVAKKIVSVGEWDTVYNESSLKIEHKYSSDLKSEGFTETAGAFCRYKTTEMTVCTPTLWASHLRKNLCRVLGIEPDLLRIQKTLPQNVKTTIPWFNTLTAIHCALASFITKKSVFLSLDRASQILYGERNFPITITHRTAFTPEGIIKAANVTILIDGGAFSPFLQTFLERLIVSSLGNYQPETFRIEAYAIRSSTPPCSDSLQWIDSYGIFAIESQLEEIARITNKNPSEIRISNLHLEQDVNLFPFIFNRSDIPELFHIVLQKSDFNRKYFSYGFTHFKNEDIDGHIPIRGIGLSSGFEGCGYMGSPINTSKISMEVTMEKNGSVTIHSHAPSASVFAIWKSLVSSLLDIPINLIVLDSKFEVDEESIIPETVMENISIMTHLLKKCCTAIQKQRFRQPLPISIKRTNSNSKKNEWNNIDLVGKPFHSSSTGVAVAEIEINPVTYSFFIRGIWLAIDGGLLLDEKRAESAIQQKVQQLLSQLMKKTILPVEKVSVTFLKKNNEPKQIGELVQTILPVAITNALSQALQTTIESIPVSTDILYTLLNSKDSEE